MRQAVARRSRFPRMLRWLLALTAAEVICGLLLSGGLHSAAAPQVPASAWNVSGPFSKVPTALAHRIGVPDEILQSPELLLWRSWSDDSRAAATVTSGPFDPTPY